MPEFDAYESAIEQQLKRSLAPVTAPDRLWEAIRSPRPAPFSPLPRQRAYWPVFAALLLFAAGGAARSYWRNIPIAGAPVPAAIEVAPSCHTPVYAVNEVHSGSAYSILPASAGQNTQENCVLCHVSLPGMLLVSQP